MAFTDRLPQAWKQIKKNMTDIAGKLGKTEKAVDSDKLDGHDSTYFATKSEVTTKLSVDNSTDGDGSIVYAEKYKACQFGTGWYKIAELDIFQSTTTAVINIEGAHGYNADNIVQNCSAKIIIRGGNEYPKGITVSCLCIGYENYITNTSYYNFAGTDRYEIFVKFASVYTAHAIVHGSNEQRYFKIFAEARDAGGANPDKVAESIPVFTSQNSPISKSDNGWSKLANGLIIQWGKTIDCGNVEGKLVTFPLSFTAMGSFNFFAVRNGIASYSVVEVYYVTDYAKASVSSAKIKGMYSERGVMKLVGSPDEYTWIAIGY